METCDPLELGERQVAMGTQRPGPLAELSIRRLAHFATLRAGVADATGSLKDSRSNQSGETARRSSFRNRAISGATSSPLAATARS